MEGGLVSRGVVALTITKERVGRTIVSLKLANLPDVVKAMRREGWIIEQKLVPYAAAMRRRKPKLT